MILTVPHTVPPNPRRVAGTARDVERHRGLVRWPRWGLLVLLSIGTAAPQEPAAPFSPWWSETVEQALRQSGTNRLELTRALDQTPPAQREGMAFLLTNMPAPDLNRLCAAFLLEHLNLAYQALEEAPWRDRIPTEVFLNDVLPYASLNEARDAWRPRLRELCLPLIKGCQSPSEAAQRLNATLFSQLNVRYSTRRRRPDQGPLETMESGMATCTGLSILLVDACRAVAVPARVAGTPLWANQTGNHTWVEIWDDQWHFTGAAEPDPNGLNRGWFVGNASQALRDDPWHAIYASSFKRTGLSFPLVWARHLDYVSAVNVTDRYAKPAPPVDPQVTRLLIQVLDRPDGERIAARITLTDPATPETRQEGTTRKATADRNDHLGFNLLKGHTYRIELNHDGSSSSQTYTTGTNAQEVLTLYLHTSP